MLAAEGISICFGGVQALTEVSIRVHEWEIAGLIGPNGAGKTTLFNCITGFYAPSSGRVVFLDRDITKLPAHARVNLGLARTFQNVGLVKSLTVLDNLLIAQHHAIGYSVVAGIVGMASALREERHLRENASEVLRFLGLFELRDTLVAGLPYGTLKLVEMAQALCTDPTLLMLDEPTSGMGPEEARELGDTLLKLRAELGLTILIIEHHVPLVVRVCDYVYCLNFGQVLAEGEPDYVRNHPEVVAAYLGEDDGAA